MRRFARFCRCCTLVRQKLKVTATWMEFTNCAKCCASFFQPNRSPLSTVKMISPAILTTRKMRFAFQKAPAVDHAWHRMPFQHPPFPLQNFLTAGKFSTHLFNCLDFSPKICHAIWPLDYVAQILPLAFLCMFRPGQGLSHYRFEVAGAQ